MIKIEVNKYEGGGRNFKVELDPSVKFVFKENTNLKVRFSRIDPDDFWEHSISPGVWVTFNSGMNDIVNVQLIQDDQLIYEHKYDFLIYGTELEKYFNLFCKLNHNTKGIVVGSHDGTFGHWVFSLLDKETSAIIIEGSEEQFSKLKKNYGHLDNCVLLNQIVSKDGKDVTWYKGGEGFTDSIISEVPHKYMSSQQIFSEIKQTRTLNEIIEENNYENFDWLHTDVEGYDAQLIMSLKYFPKLIIFENHHIKDNQEYNLLCEFLKGKNYVITDFDGDTLAIKN
jgi:FkbM family methyltransferase